MPRKKTKEDLFGKVKDFVVENIINRLDRIINDAVIVNGILKKIDEMKNSFIKTLAVYAIVFIGVVFVLAGIAQYLSVKLQMFAGSGYVVVGIVVIILGLLYKAVKD